MNYSLNQRFIVALAICGTVAALGIGRAAGNRATLITVIDTPNGGIQPQAVAGSDGSLHLLYFKGLPQTGDLYYVKAPADSRRFSAPIRVNSQPGSAVAMGTIRGGQI